MIRLFSALAALPLLLLLASPAAARSADLFPAGVVSAADPRASQAGAEMLRQGGTAADAALAVLLALNVVEPQSSGIGGGGLLVYRDGKGRISTFDGRETAPAAASPQWFAANGQYLAMGQVVPGGLSVGVPGNVAMMALAHRKHGKLAWKAVFAPAIRLAREGFTISPRLHQFLNAASRTAAHSPGGLALFHDAEGKLLPAGTLVRNPEFASLLEDIAHRGPRAFYRGARAERIASAVAQASHRPAPMQASDLAAYRAKQRPPVCGSYRRNRICVMGPPSSGATSVLGMLAMLERFDMAAFGKDSITPWHLFAEAQRLVFADRDRYLADADFVDVPIAGLLAPDYLAARAQLIAPDRAMASVAAGAPAGVRVAMADAPAGEVPSTSHLAVIDRKGRAASLTSTIEGPFGSGIVVSGMYLNNELTDFAMVPEKEGRLVANRVEAGKRPLSSMSPTLVSGPDGGLRMAIGAAGGRTIPVQVTKAIIGVIDWGLSAEQAIALPLVFAASANTLVVEQGTSMQARIPEFLALGHAEVRTGSLPLKANAVEVVNGALVGAADQRSEGVPARE